MSIPYCDNIPGGPTPDNIKIWGFLNAPATRIISVGALMRRTSTSGTAVDLGFSPDRFLLLQIPRDGPWLLG